MIDNHLSRRELAAVAVALLLPIPLLTASGLHIPLPGVIERGLASLTPVQDFDVAGVQAAIVPAATEEAAAPSVTETNAADDTPSPASSHSVSSTAIAPAAAGAASSRAEGRDDKTTAQPDLPGAPEPHTDDRTPPARPEADTDVPVKPPAAAVAAEPASGTEVQAGVTVEVEAASASVEVGVTDNSITLDTGGSADVGPPVELPVAPPSQPLPVPLP